MTDLPPPVPAGVMVYHPTSYMHPRKMGGLLLKVLRAKMAKERRGKSSVRTRAIRAARAGGGRGRKQ